MTSTPDFAVVSRFPVEVGERDPRGMLGPALNSGELVLRSPVADQLDFRAGGNIGSILIIDIDRSGIVGQVEILTPEPRWSRGNVPPMASRPEPGVLLVPQLGREIVVEDNEPFFTFDESDRTVLVEIEPTSQDTRYVALSDFCIALINESFLAGFRVILEQAHHP
jgi:hypothetical protein